MTTTPEQLRAISIRQPWAEAILRGEKTVEYRSQPTKNRGRVYIYAAPGTSDAEQLNIAPELAATLSDLPRGVLVGTVEIADCVGSDGEYEWLLANPQRLSEPLAPVEQPQPVWFYPFGRPEDAEQSPVEPDLDAEADGESGLPVSNTRFAPVIAATDQPPSRRTTPSTSPTN